MARNSRWNRQQTALVDHGVEGPTVNPDDQALRERQSAICLARLLFSQEDTDAARGRRARPHPKVTNNFYGQDAAQLDLLGPPSTTLLAGPP